MSSKADIQQAIQALEQQRSILGDSVVNAAIATLKQQLNEQESSAERKLVTVMFADISGFTALSEKKDPEVVRSLMNKCFDSLVPIVLKCKGTIDKFIGDEIMALFGAPVANEKHAELACHCALELMEQLETFNQENGLELGLHIGLNTGLVVAGGIGSEGKQQYSVMGDTVNLGSRLKDKASNGEIFAGPELYKNVFALFDFQKLEPMLVKGKEEPIQVYSLKNKIKQTAGGRLTNTPIIGRDVELKLLNDSYSNLTSNRRGSVISIIGEAGIGKSRLLNEGKRQLNENIKWFESRAFSHLSQVSYRPVKEMLLTMLPDEASENGDSLRSELTRLLQTFGNGLADQLFPFLASLLGIVLTENENALIKYLDPAARRQKLQGSFIAFVNERVRHEPIILIWEDLHWADKETLQTIEKLCAVCSEDALINVLSFRPQKEEPIWHLHEKLKGIKDYQFIELDPLTADENKLLIQNMINNETEFAEAAKLIFEKSEGNPFYTEELFRTLTEQGYFQRKNNGKSAMSGFTLPTTLQGIVASRIDKLSPAEKWALQTSSVVGRIIDLPVLHALVEMSGKKVDIDSTINALLASDMIRKSDSGYEDSDEYFFKHAITQEVAYNSLLISTRLEIHNQVADVISKVYGNDHFFIVAKHYENGNNPAKAIEYYKQSAEYAAASFAHENELTSYSGAASLATKLYDQTGAEIWKKEQYFLYEKAGDIYNKQIRREEALTCYDTALQFAGSDLVGKARLNRKKALCFEAVHSASKAVIDKYYEEAENLLDNEKDRSKQWHQEWIDLQLDKCWAYYWQSKLDLLQKTLVLIELALPANGSVFQKARYLNNKVTLEFRSLVYQLNQHTIDIAYEALDVNKQAGDLRQIANTWFQLGFTLLWSNKIDESIRVFEEHWSDINKVGDKVIATRGITYFYIAYRRAGNVDRAEKLVNEYLYSGNYPPVPEYLFAANSTLVWINWKRKNYKSMEDHYIKAMQILKPVNLFTPFHFLYVMPMVDWYLQTNALDKVNPLLKDLTLPHQRKLEPDLREVIDKCLANGENGVPDKQMVKAFLDLAREYKYL